MKHPGLVSCKHSYRARITAAAPPPYNIQVPAEKPRAISNEGANSRGVMADRPLARPRSSRLFFIAAVKQARLNIWLAIPRSHKRSRRDWTGPEGTSPLSGYNQPHIIKPKPPQFPPIPLSRRERERVRRELCRSRPGDIIPWSRASMPRDRQESWINPGDPNEIRPRRIFTKRRAVKSCRPFPRAAAHPRKIVRLGSMELSLPGVFPPRSRRKND